MGTIVWFIKSRPERLGLGQKKFYGVKHKLPVVKFLFALRCFRGALYAGRNHEIRDLVVTGVRGVAS